MNKGEIYIAIRDKYGFRAQLAKAAEECAECSAAINKMIVWELSNERSAESFSALRQRIIEEMADVYTTLEQAEQILEIDESELYGREIANLCKMKKMLDKPESAYNN